MSYLKVNSGGGARNNYLKRILIFLVALIIYFLLVTGSTYAYLYLENKNSNITGKGGCFVVDYQATSINASNLVSTVNYQDGASSVITISKNSSCNIYDYANIYLHTNENITAMLEQRHLSQRIRRGGGKTPNTKKRTIEDDNRLEKNLSYLLKNKNIE